MRHLEKVIYLQSIDTLWKEHLLAMDHLKEGIGLRGYGQRNPLQEYQKEGYQMFMELISSTSKRRPSRSFTGSRSPAPQRWRNLKPPGSNPWSSAMGRRGRREAQPVKRESKKVGRNDPCPCGSGKKYKKCHGR